MTGGIKLVGIVPIVVAAATAACSEQDGSSEGPLAEVQQDVIVTNCTQPSPVVPISYDREMVIRGLSVVEDGISGDGNDDLNDHCRTAWTPCDPSRMGRWTFGWMMTAMSGSSDVTSSTAKTFVKNWLKLWLSPQEPNLGKAAVSPRTAITETLIDPWLSASGCPAGATLDTCDLDLRRAPFRLLAFVNRADLPAIPGYSTGEGEFRVVFGAVGYDPINGVPDTSLQATVILEYNFPNSKSLQQWAVALHELSSFDPEAIEQTGTYRTKLQAITDAIVGPNAAPFAHNRSPIAHVRTNEIAFDCQMGSSSCGGLAPDPTLAQWEFRQFKLNGPDFSLGVPLVQDTVSQTPQTSDNLTQAINDQLINNRTVILGGDQAFPDGSSLVGNASHSPPGSSAVIWEKGVLNSTNAPELTSATRAQTRHQFAFGTCNGCHYVETGNQNGLFHIGPRDEGQVAAISSFLSAGGASNPLAGTSDTLAPITQQTVLDPAGSGVKFKYNEPWRRACEIRRILSGSTVQFTKPTGHIK